MKHDVLILAQLLRADLIPEVWLPFPHLRDLRALISHRQRLLRARTKEGRRELGSVLVEAAQTASRTHRYWQGEFQRLARRIGEKKAIVALARKLLIVTWRRCARLLEWPPARS